MRMFAWSYLLLTFTALSMGQAEESKSSSKPAVSTPSKPETKPKYGSGSKPEPAHHEPSKPPETKPKYGSGSKPEPAPGKPEPSKPPETKPKYGSGTTAKTGPEPKSTLPPSVGTKPHGPSFDQKAGQAQQKEESKQKYVKGKEPAPTYTDPKGNVQKIDPKDAKIERLRNQLDEEKWRNRDLRERNFYARYYDRPVLTYSLPYNSYFYYWMFDQTLEQQALWMYHHQIQARDRALYADMVARNAELAARVRALETQHVAVNATYEPAGAPDTDLMYTKKYAEAAYNPDPPPHHEAGESSWLCLWVGLGILGAAGGIWLIWFVFFKKWPD